jgi:uncharacterized protein YuzE
MTIKVVDPLYEPFKAGAIYYPESDRLEIVLEDCATITRHVAGSDVYMLVTMDDERRIVGLGIEYASERFPELRRR